MLPLAQELLEQLKQNVEVHSDHLAASKAFEDWCSSFCVHLGDVKRASGEKDDVTVRLKSAKVKFLLGIFAVQKDQATVENFYLLCSFFLPFIRNAGVDAEEA